MIGFMSQNTYRCDFLGGGAIPTTLAAGMEWKLTDTSPTGTPTCGFVSPSPTGEYQMVFSNTNEGQNLCLDFGDILSFDIDNLQSVAFGLRVNTATLNANTRLAFGMQSARNDNTDNTTNNMQFLLAGNNALLLETDDNATDVDDVATSFTLTNAAHRFVIDLTAGKNNIRFHAGQLTGSLSQLAPNRVFSMAGTGGSLQPFFQIQKSSGTQTDGVIVDYVEIEYKRLV